MSRIQYAMERMYGNQALTNELRDEEAQSLLKWGEKEVEHIDQKTDDSDEEQFQNRFKQVEQIIKRVNKFVGFMGEYTPEQAREKLQVVLEVARDLEHNVDDAQVEQFLSSYQSMSSAEAVTALLDIVKDAPSDTADTPPTPSQAPVAASDAPPVPEDADAPEALLPAETSSQQDKRTDPKTDLNDDDEPDEEMFLV